MYEKSEEAITDIKKLMMSNDDEEMKESMNLDNIDDISGGVANRTRGNTKNQMQN